MDAKYSTFLILAKWIRTIVRQVAMSAGTLFLYWSHHACSILKYNPDPVASTCNVTHIKKYLLFYYSYFMHIL